MNASHYDWGRGKHGWNTEQVLRGWLQELPSESKVGKRLMSRLASVLAAYGKSVRKGASVHAPKDWLKLQE